MKQALVMLSIVMLVALPAIARVQSDITLEATPETAMIELTVTMEMAGDPPEEWVGWTIDRTTVGSCEMVSVGGVLPFPDDQQSYTAIDAAVEDGITYRYEVVAVTDQGDHVIIDGFGFSPTWLRIDYAGLGMPYASVGVLEGSPGDYMFIACPGACWPDLLIFDSLPQDLADLAGTGTTIVLFGDIGMEFEGPYLADLLDWSVVSDCDAIVGNDTRSWSSLKQIYR